MIKRSVSYVTNIFFKKDNMFSFFVPLSHVFYFYVGKIMSIKINYYLIN